MKDRTLVTRQDLDAAKCDIKSHFDTRFTDLTEWAIKPQEGRIARLEGGQWKIYGMILTLFISIVGLTVTLLNFVA